MNSRHEDEFLEKVEEEEGVEAEEKQALRRQAEERLASALGNPGQLDASDEAQQLLHELQVHQIELEMQNEDLRRTQESLLAAQARYFDLYNLAPVGYLTLSQKGIILEANLTGAEMLGTTRSLLQGQPFTHHILPEDQDIYYRFRQLLAKTNKPQQCELRLAHPAADPTWVHLDGVVGGEKSGDTLPLRITLSDITALRRTEAKLLRSERNLAETQRLKLVGQLAGGIAHEFNNMLAVILLRTEMTLYLVEQGSKAQRNLAAIQATAEQSATLVSQLLGFARKQIIEPIPLNLNQVISQTRPMLAGLLGAEIELIWLPGDLPCLVKMDPVQLDQVLVSLCLNARDAITGKGKVTIEAARATVTGQPQALPPGHYVTLTVTDSGQGMDNQVLAHLFEPFFTTKEVGKGVGLGLPMVEGVIKQNRGHIEVISAPGQGATFRIYLPCFGNASTPVRPEKPSAPYQRGEGTVLFVEDSPLILDAVTEFLDDQGYTVLPAATPGEALAQAENFPGVIHLLLTDIVLPEMNGGQLADLILALRPQIQVLYASGYPAEAVTSRGVAITEGHFLQKPYALDDLAAKIRGMLPVDG